MRMTDLLDIKSIDLQAKPGNKGEALDQAVALMVRGGHIRDEEGFRRQVYDREKESTTGVGDGIAIPHGKSEAVGTPGLAAMVIPGGVEFDALDDQPVTLLFLIAAPDTQDNVHLDVLSKLAVMLMDGAFADRLRQAKTPEAFREIVDAADQATADHAGDGDGKPAQEAEEKICKKKVLAVTSCPTGIAHTYMAAEGLSRAAGHYGLDIRIETRGSAGAKNVLTDEEIEAADAIIVAADARVPMERFEGKKLIQCPVSDGISKADVLMEKVLCGDIPIYRSKTGGRKETAGGDRDTVSGASGSGAGVSGGAGHRVYTQLMNGVSHMLPFVVGGGILIALAFLIDGMLVDMDLLTAEERSSFGSITPAAALLKRIGDVAFGFMLPVLAGFIAEAIGDRPALAVGFVGGMIAAGGKSGFLGALAAGFAAGYIVVLLRAWCSHLPDALEKLTPVLIYPLLGILLIGLGMNYVVEPIMGTVNTALNSGLAGMGSTSRILLGLVLGGMMAIDMGGPFNKAAYVFGTASIAAGNNDIMAAVMVGGMCPPCAIALATLLFGSRFTDEEREAGPTNFIMGLAFITEGAIPYAAADPLRVLPACIIGSGVAGAISMAFGCGLMAPHGGIFVFPVVENVMMYIVALIAGTLVSAILLGLFKKAGSFRS